MHRRRASALAAQLVLGSLAAGACHEVPAGPVTATPVITMTLIAGESLQVATITEAMRADSVIPVQPPGIPGARVALLVTDDSGVVAPLVPDSGSGRYVLRMRVRPGAAYRLEGEVADRPVRAVTTVPSRFAIREPAGDTIRAAAGNCPVPFSDYVLFGFACVRGAFDVEGVAAIEYRVRSPTGEAEWSNDLAAPAGDLVFRRLAGVRRVIFVGYNQEAWDWLSAVGNPIYGNVSGVLGYFGAALVERRYLETP
jgi:hypothetical protein